MGEPLKVFIIGSGGREHALCWKLAQSPGAQIYAAPGNAGIAQIATTLVTSDYVAAAERFRPDLVVIGPEAPLVAGVADELRAKGVAVVGPSAAAAQIESSKHFAKQLMEAAGIPTARHVSVESIAEARRALRGFPLPVVLKADGLAAGKGVVIAETADDAERALPGLFAFSRRLVIEEYLDGEEVSFMVLTDGTRVLALEPTQDHKRIYDDDRGPNTGGMGAYCDSRILDDAQRQKIMATIIEPALHQMRTQGHAFNGFLYAGLMLTADGPKVLEFNARLGDPETQAIVYRLDSDLLPALIEAAHGELRQTSIASK
ncbi:MAG: phosphoribosylamine--glycine ligase, partial [Acidobacteriaceae bacterium]|nr:phosphoribosylamine--glycine ligase [Acidobacteriaceae bacterium]